MQPNRPRLIIDLRCLQDRRYAERGIGNHARCIVAGAPAPFIGIIDPRLPELPGDVAARAAELSPHGYLPGLGPGAVFLNPSPMSPDQNFIARLLLDSRLSKAACVHDFIPYDEPETYLAHPVNRLEYFAAMAWLRRYDVFLPNSEPTRARLAELYGDVRAEVTGVALPGWLAGVKAGAPRHILMVGGDDARKNPEVLAAAHASSAVLREVPLVIAGAVDAGMAARLRAVTRVALPGKVSDDEMRGLYAGAICVVAPSRAEGFSLPVIEASAVGVPVVASDIAAHRALGVAAALRFAPGDGPRLAGILERLVAEPGRREEVVAAQAGIARDFTPAAVAKRVFSALAGKPAVARGRRARVAVMTPMPPVKSGIADYSAAMVAALREFADVAVFEASAPAFLEARYDRVVSVLGNSPLHARLYELVLRWGSAVICHDARLMGLAAARGLAGAAEAAGRELGRVVAPAEVFFWAQDERRREASFLGEVAAAARPLIVHGERVAALAAARFGVRAEVIPFAVQRVFERRRRPAGTGLIVSFGFIARGKGIEVLLRAFAEVRRERACRLVFAGAATEYTAGFERLAGVLGVADSVVFGAGFLAEAAYRDLLMTADCAVQLREGAAGNVSGALQDCIATGVPAVANDDLAETLGAPGFVRRVSDRLEVGEVAAALREVLAAGEDTEAARADYCGRRGMREYARRLVEVLGVL